MKKQQKNDQTEQQNLIQLIEYKPVQFEELDFKMLNPIQLSFNKSELIVSLFFNKSELRVSLYLEEFKLKFMSQVKIQKYTIFQDDSHYSYIDQHGILHEPKTYTDESSSPDLYRFMVTKKVLIKVASDNYLIGYKDISDFKEYERVGPFETNNKVVENYKKIAEQQKLEHFLELAGICKNGTLNESLSHDLENNIFSYVKLSDINNLDNDDILVSGSDYYYNNFQEV